MKTLLAAGRKQEWDYRVVAGVEDGSRENTAAAIWKKAASLTHKRTLKMELKIGRRTLAVWENHPQVFHGLQQRVGLPTGGW